MLLLLLPYLAAHMEQLNTMSPGADFSLPLPIPAFVNITSAPLNIIPLHHLHHLPIHVFPKSGNRSFLSISQSLSKTNLSTDLYNYPLLVSVSIPHIYRPLVLNSITQLVCIAGVHRLTTRVSAIRKAISLIIHNRYHACGTYDPWFRFFSIGKNLLYPRIGRINLVELVWTRLECRGGFGEKLLQEVDMRLMWTGAAHCSLWHHWIYDRKSTT